jgi:hypothetical protein
MGLMLALTLALTTITVAITTPLALFAAAALGLSVWQKTEETEGRQRLAALSLLSGALG